VETASGAEERGREVFRDVALDATADGEAVPSAGQAGVAEDGDEQEGEEVPLTRGISSDDGIASLARAAPGEDATGNGLGPEWEEVVRAPGGMTREAACEQNRADDASLEETLSLRAVEVTLSPSAGHLTSLDVWCPGWSSGGKHKRALCRYFARRGHPIVGVSLQFFAALAAIRLAGVGLTGSVAW
jgi:hypothetical protein